MELNLDLQLTGRDIAQAFRIPLQGIMRTSSDNMESSIVLLLLQNISKLTYKNLKLRKLLHVYDTTLYLPKLQVLPRKHPLSPKIKWLCYQKINLHIRKDIRCCLNKCSNLLLMSIKILYQNIKRT